MSGSVLVVGATGGVGLAVTQMLVRQGVSVIATVRTASAATLLQAEEPGIKRTVMLDLSNPEDVATDLAKAEIADLSAVVVCAAASAVGPLETIPLATVRRTLDINSISAIAIYQACMPLLRKSRGRLIFVSSFAGKVAMPFVGAYSGSKFALEGFADVMRREASPFGVAVIVVEPGGVLTAMVQDQIEAAERERAALTAEQAQLYGPLFDIYQKVFAYAAVGGMQPSIAAETVSQALTAIDPEPRYVVGDDALYMCKTVAAMPDREIDRTLAAYFSSLGQA